MKTEEFRELCTEEGFDADQIREFELAISHGLNIKLLVNLACDAKCMHEIILGMLHHVDVNLWHYRLGHPGHNVVKQICDHFPYVQADTNVVCDVCHYAKQHKLPFSQSMIVSANCFD